MRKITKYLFTPLLGMVIFTSCSKKEPSIVYMPDMYYPVAYDPYQETFIVYDDHENTVPLFKTQEGKTALAPVKGTIPLNPDNVLPMDLPATNEGYDASKLIIRSLLNPENADADLKRGKYLYEKTCLVCHGSSGDGQGPIVQSGAYSGVASYKDRQVSVGSVYYVIEHGKNAMNSYAGLLLPGDRWRVAEYVMKEFK